MINYFSKINKIRIIPIKINKIPIITEKLSFGHLIRRQRRHIIRNKQIGHTNMLIIIKIINNNGLRDKIIRLPIFAKKSINLFPIGSNGSPKMV